MVRKPKKVSQFNKKKEEFLKNVNFPLIGKDNKEKRHFCSVCGNKADSDASICSYCGTTLKNRM